MRFSPIYVVPLISTLQTHGHPTHITLLSFSVHGMTSTVEAPQEKMKLLGFRLSKTNYMIGVVEVAPPSYQGNRCKVKDGS